MKVNQILLFNEKEDDLFLASLKVYKEGRSTVFEFTVQTKRLYRMKDPSLDNRVELSVNRGKLYYFTPSMLTDSPYSFDVTLLENNNKKSRYKIKVYVDENVESYSAIAEGSTLRMN